MNTSRHTRPQVQAPAAQTSTPNREEDVVLFRSPVRPLDLPVAVPNRVQEVPTFTPAERQALIIGHYDTVKAIARKIRARLPKGVDVDDLIGYGVLGLIEAIDRYDATRSVPFEAFARPRIQGAILDALRAIDWVPRSVRRKAELLDSTKARLRETLGRDPSRVEVAKRLGLPVNKLDRLERGADIRSISSLDAPISADSDTTVMSTLANDEDLIGDWAMTEMTDEVVEAVRRLPDRERQAVTMYYLDEKSLKDIGDELGVSESRACQLRRQGVERLRFKVRHHLE